MTRRIETVPDKRTYERRLQEYIMHGYKIQNQGLDCVKLRKHHNVSWTAAFWWFILGFIGFIIYLGIFCPAKPQDKLELRVATRQPSQLVYIQTPYGIQAANIPLGPAPGQTGQVSKK